MGSGPTSMESGVPRVVLLSQRHIRPWVSRLLGYEFERVIGELTDPFWAVPEQPRVGRMPEVLVNRLNKRLKVASSLKAPFPRIDIPDADLLVAVMQLPADLTTLAALPGWRSRCTKAVVYIEEMWSVELDKWKGHLALLDQFDHVFLGSQGTVAELAARIDTPVSYLPYGVDTTVFAPADPRRDRPIAVTNIGRRSPVTHQALLDWAAAGDHFYYHDTFSPGPFHDAEEHRRLLANIMQRTQVAIANRGIGVRPHETGYQEEVGFRFFEAAAGGALLVGQPPNSGAAHELFDWEDALIEVDFAEPDIGAMLDELLADPDRITAAHVRNRRYAIERHDHLHRFQAMCDAAGVDAGPLAAARRAVLADLAAV
ncbi:MAG: glycosyltransferase family 1 protein [Acidimicrobiales bacterium]|nr:glycosyltransferase family 1 protein [Acidimicrobiales bacterium]